MSVPERKGRVGPYRLLDVLGVGSTGTVLRARHIEQGHEVAVKLLHPHLKSEPLVLRRFANEARLAQRVRHNHVVEIRDFGKDGAGNVYFAMSLVRGGSLSDLLRREGPLSIERVLRLGRQIAWALEATHRAGIVHRDVKPSNILIDAGPAGEHAVLADFGIAKPFVASRAPGIALTREGTTVGTPTHMSLEQALGEEVGPAADVYAFGVVMFEMLTGRRPYEGRDLPSIVVEMTRGATPRPGAANRRVPGALDRLVRACLALRPGERPRSMAFVASRLGSMLEGKGKRRCSPGRWRSRAQAAAAAVVMASLARADRASVGTPAGADAKPVATHTLARPLDEPEQLPPPLWPTLPRASASGSGTCEPPPARAVELGGGRGEGRVPKEPEEAASTGKSRRSRPRRSPLPAPSPSWASPSDGPLTTPLEPPARQPRFLRMFRSAP